MKKIVQNGGKGFFSHRRRKGSRVLSLALSASMLLGTLPSGAFPVYAESQVIYGSSDDDADEAITLSSGTGDNSSYIDESEPSGGGVRHL
ncbi:MAG: hypothetical protein IJX90_09450 [Blautia sp.]|nr:hypothetical protein [Blautia sp.]